MEGEKRNNSKAEFQMKQITIPIKGNYSEGEPPMKRLSDEEFRARLDKGLCFRFNEKYSHGHHCNVKEKRKLMLFIMNEEGGEGEGNVLIEGDEEVMELKNLEVPAKTEIETRTIMGFSSKRTMKLRIGRS
ncbi:retrotransposon protein [Cucumis melo var. makuwa]|uniref:Retrotransposon protein n=1 Tax=Cucumis melo var. makuwa TaxID=1194695 RepID=A0A5D3C108_CUCMM|nr:retrotransposon protein [Cucumis melo var. makuwa]